MVFTSDCNTADCTLNSAYIEVAFNEKSAITKENPHTKYFPLTVMLKMPPIMKSLYEIATYNNFLKLNLFIFASINKFAYFFSGDACHFQQFVCVVVTPC